MEFRARRVLAQRVRILRNAHGWSQEVLAYLSGLNRSYIGAVERSEHNIGLDNIAKIALAFDVSVADLVSDSQTTAIEEILGNGNGAGCAGIPAQTSAVPPSVTVNRETFLRLLKHYREQQPDSLLDYLRLRGVIVVD